MKKIFKNIIVQILVVISINFNCSFVCADVDFNIINSSVYSGQENVDIRPVFTFEFNNEINSSSLSSILLNNESDKVVAKINGSQKEIELSIKKELLCDAYYTLDLSQLCDIRNVKLGETITFKTKPDYNQNCNLEIVSSTVLNNSLDVPVNPDLSFKFNHRIAPVEFTPSINGDEEYIKSCSVLPQDDTVLNIQLSKKLEYDTEYALDLSDVADVYGNFYNNTFKFKTMSDTIKYNVCTDDFESGNEIDDSKWRVNNETTAKIVSDPTNKLNSALHLKGTASASAQFDNNYCVSADMPGDVVLEFDFMLPESMLAYEYRYFLSMFGENEEGKAGSVSNSQLMRAYTNSNKTGFDIKFKNSDASYTQVATVNASEWIKISMVIKPLQSSYEIFVNGKRFDHNFEFQNRVYTDKINQIRFNAYNGYEIYIDNIKIAQRFSLVPNDNGIFECFYNANGEYTNSVDPVKTSHKAKFMNNGPTDESLTLFLALYDSDSNTLIDVKKSDFIVKANSIYIVDIGFENFGQFAASHCIKAIYVNNEAQLNPFKKSIIPFDAMIIYN